ncbi:hypothetical protein ACLBSL_32575, partial [Klebsiella pneumoniae]|uniref:hypothetical protein n=1 Tax=Klebsiella pneumoniae TaxID=573 RepID=UPI00396944D7
MSFYLPRHTDPIEAIEWKKNGDIPGDGVINNINQGAIVGYAIPTKESTLSNAMKSEGQGFLGRQENAPT